MLAVEAVLEKSLPNSNIDPPPGGCLESIWNLTLMITDITDIESFHDHIQNVDCTNDRFSFYASTGLENDFVTPSGSTACAG